ncbi:hypothetical protein WJX72_007644 [[Myrmecia] bisecta]|uniref:SIR2-like domain-containing protein n=1 Tax=[Myrmecia] bisecta TaxID=41462 RepID=A0AAW1R8N7_9CHLO
MGASCCTGSGGSVSRQTGMGHEDVAPGGPRALPPACPPAVLSRGCDHVLVVPGTRTEEWTSAIRKAYLGEDELLRGWNPAHVMPEVIKAHVVVLEERITAARARLSNEELRKLDLSMMQAMRRDGCLSVVSGAGVSIGAGAPDWPSLVKQLIHHCEAGRPIYEEHRDQAADGRVSITRSVVDRQFFTAEQAQVVREALEEIERETATDEVLKRACDVCLKLFGQELFGAGLCEALYGQDRRRQPGAVHRAIAEVAAQKWQRRSGIAEGLAAGSRQGWGWDAIITYNFDDLHERALQDIPTAAYVMRTGKSGPYVAGDPNPKARALGIDSVHQKVYHLHGYVPARLFNIGQVCFVFATSQYEQFYEKQVPDLLTVVRRNYLEKPVKYALYVGCSFMDTYMNRLLENAHKAMPGRYHYALLLWPGAKTQSFVGATQQEVDRQSERYLAMGVRPVWFDSYDELPSLIRGLI